LVAAKPRDATAMRQPLTINVLVLRLMLVNVAPQIARIDTDKVGIRVIRAIRGGLSSNFKIFLSSIPPQKTLSENPPKSAILNSPFAFPQTRFARSHPQSPVPSHMRPLSRSSSGAQVGRGMSGMLVRPDTSRATFLCEMRRAGACD
jgi:hypothetical protein